MSIVRQLLYLSYHNRLILVLFPVNGTTGEGPSLTLEERKQTAKKWIEFGKTK